MAHILPIGFLDTGLLWANYRLRYADTLRGPGPVLGLPLFDRERGGLPILTGEKKFGSAIAFMRRLEASAAGFLGGRPGVILSAVIASLEPNGFTEWWQSYDQETIQVRVALATNPAAWFYCGGEAVQMGVGVINYVNVQALHCQANFGASSAVHLVVDFARPPVEPAGV